MAAKQWDSIWINGSVATCDDGYGFIKNGAIAVQDGKIAWVGEQEKLPGAPENLAIDVYDLTKYCLTPGLIDCHTQLVYAGNRYQDFELRNQEKNAADIENFGDGIESIMAATQDASDDDLLLQSCSRSDALAMEGVTTLEIKSTYGQDLDTDLKILRTVNQIADGFQLVPTYFYGYELSPEFSQNPDKYIDYVCDELLPALVKEKLVRHIDIFCKNTAFTVEQTERTFKTAKEFGLGIKCHAEQLSTLGALSLMTQYQVLSVDHPELLSDENIRALAKTGAVAILLPGIFYFAPGRTLPQVELLRETGFPMAIATGCNSDTSPVTSILLMLNMACTLLKLTPIEAIQGVTKHAATALGLGTSLGTLTVGKEADFCIWNIQHPKELVYRIGFNPLVEVIKKGVC
jgi:imidazolonepropionase